MRSLLFLIFLSCASSELVNIKPLKSEIEQYKEIRDTNCVELFWTKPDYSSTVTRYEVFYKTKTSGLILIDSMIPPKDSPQIKIYRNQISPTDSIFYFAVRYITFNNQKSEFHYSYDSTAIPKGGWLLVWKNNSK